MPYPRSEKSVTLTIVILVLLFAGLYFIWRGMTTAPPTKVKIGDSEVETTSVGIVVLVIDGLIVLAVIARKGSVILPTPETPKRRTDYRA